MVPLSIELSSKFLCTVLLQIKVYMREKKAPMQEGSALKQPFPNFFSPHIFMFIFICF